MINDREKYGGIFLYEISSGDYQQYIVSNPDMIKELLAHPKIDEKELGDEVNIKKLGRVLINGLTLDRLVADNK